MKILAEDKIVDYNLVEEKKDDTILSATFNKQHLAQCLSDDQQLKDIIHTFEQKILKDLIPK